MVSELIANALPVMIGILVFGVLIMAHEWGHFFAARKCGVLVEEFAIGMGPKLVGIQRGETLYTIRLIPMGGYCKMLGDGEEEGAGVEDDRAFNRKSLPRRMIIMLAGAAMNMALAVLLFFIVVYGGGFAAPVVRALSPGAPAEEAGVLPGDRIKKIGGFRIHTYEDILLAVSQSKGEAVDVTLDRGGQTLVKTITPVPNGDTFIIGVRPVIKTGLFAETETAYERAGALESVAVSFWQMGFWIKSTFYGIGEMVNRNISVSEMSGPIGVVNIIGETYEQSVKVSVWATIRTMLNIAGMLSASIGIFNLLPVPALDGGRFVFLLLEGLRGKPIPQEKEGMVHLIGFVMLMALGVFIAYNDILKLL